MKLPIPLLLALPQAVLGTAVVLTAYTAMDCLPTARDLNCRSDYCTSYGNDCCAPNYEEATCSNGYAAIYSGEGCWTYDNGDYTCCAPATDASAGDTLYYSKWGDDCQENGGHDDECRAFATEEDCWNYCNPHSDNDNDQCDAHGHDLCGNQNFTTRSC